MTRRERKRLRKEAWKAEVERRRADEKDCYCGPDDAYCGTCRVCGRPGHTRHFPGAAPYTGAWCDFHYLRTALLHPNGRYGCWLWAGTVMFALALASRLLS